MYPKKREGTNRDFGNFAICARSTEAFAAPLGLDGAVARRTTCGMTKARLLLAIIVAFSFHGLAQERTLDVYWVDSEGGGSTLLVTPAKESILIDTGNPGGRDAKRIYEVATKVAGITNVDHMVITHFHIDHFGGAAELARLMPVRNVYDHGIPDGNPDNNPNDTRWLLLSKPYREFKAGKRHVIKPGDTLEVKQTPGTATLSVRCLAAKQRFVKAADKRNELCARVMEKPKDTTDNANSVVTLVQFGDFRFFDGGDLTWNTEADLVCPNDRVGQVDVFQVNHHGLDVSNNPLLLKTLRPQVAVMNNGARKGANPETCATIKDTDSVKAWYQVHRNVQHAASNPPEEFIANLPDKCEGHYIKMSVDATGKSYTFSIPANGHKQTYQTIVK